MYNYHNFGVKVEYGSLKSWDKRHENYLLNYYSIMTCNHS